MQKISNFREANEVLLRFVPPPKQYQAAVKSLANMTQLMEALGNPQDTYKTIHVAGTSGKTSTSYYIASFLQQAGQKVGLTVSPHVDEVNERVQINLTPLSEAEFCTQLSKFLEILDGIGITPSYFEILIAFAYWQFAQEHVDYAVIEVGMGGRLDATNVISREDKVCVITDIGLDHTEYLGDTLAKVAAEKAGIIQSHTPTFIYKQDPSVMEVVEATATKQQAPLHIVTELVDEKLPPSLPLFQKRNWYLAEEVFAFVAKRDGLNAINNGAKQKAINTYIPARMEITQFQGKAIITDGSHNAQKLHALTTSIRQRFPHESIAALVSFGAGDESRMHGGMDEIMKIADRIVATTFAVAQDAPKLPVDPEEIVVYGKSHGFANITAVADPRAAFEQLLAGPEPIILATGSFFLLNHIRPLLFKA